MTSTSDTLAPTGRIAAVGTSAAEIEAAAARSAVVNCSAHGSTTPTTSRFGYFGSVAPSWRSQRLTVFLDSPLRRLTSRIDRPSRKCIRLILANMPTLITPASPAHVLSRAVSLRGSDLDDRDVRRWVSFQ